jgi:hypothetical protein
MTELVKKTSKIKRKKRRLEEEGEAGEGRTCRMRL